MSGSGQKRAPRSRLRETLMWLYMPWNWLVFIPFLAVTTLLWGSMGMLLWRLSKRVAFHCGTIWAFCLLVMNFTPAWVRGRKRARPGQSYVIMSNHQSHFDVLAFYGLWRRQFRWVMKEELRRVPFLGSACAGIGHIFIDRSDRERAIASLRAARPLLDGGISVLIFPEGSRSRAQRMRDFKKGGFMMALEWGLPILPVTITGSRWVLPGKTLSLLPGLIRIQIHEPVDVTAYGLERREELMRDVRAIIASGLPPAEREASLAPPSEVE